MDSNCSSSLGSASFGDVSCEEDTDYLDTMLDYVHGIEQQTKDAGPLAQIPVTMTPLSGGTFHPQDGPESGEPDPVRRNSGAVKDPLEHEAKTPVVTKKSLCTGVSSPTDVRHGPHANPFASYIFNTSPLLEELRQQDQMYDGSSISSAEEEMELNNSFLDANPFFIQVPDETSDGRISPFSFHDAVDRDPVDVQLQTTQRFHDSFELIEDIEKNFPTVQRTLDFPSFVEEFRTSAMDRDKEQQQQDAPFKVDFGNFPELQASNKQLEQPHASGWGFCQMQTRFFDGIRQRLRTNRRYFTLVQDEDSFAENERVSL